MDDVCISRVSDAGLAIPRETAPCVSFLVCCQPRSGWCLRPLAGLCPDIAKLHSSMMSSQSNRSAVSGRTSVDLP